MISYYETFQGATWAIVLNEKGEVISRQRVPLKKGPSLGGWHPPVDESLAPPVNAAGESR